MIRLIERIKDFVSNVFGIGPELSFDGWECTYSDDFSEIDENTWSPCEKGKPNWCRFMCGNIPTVHSESGETFVRLECDNDFKNNTFVTNGITTKGKRVFSPGRIEVTARFKPGKTTWPAIWMVNNGNTSIDEYYEIDMCEYLDDRDSVNVTFHCPSSMNKKSRPIYRTSRNFNKDGWNTFVCEWDEDHIMVFVNGKRALTVVNEENQTRFPVNIKDRFFFLILSMQYSRSGSLKPDISELPLWMDVKTVRHWRKS